MKIECLRIRPGGTTVELDGETYHFRPEGTETRHIAEVSKVAHIKTLLSIAAYQVADDAVADMTGTVKKVSAKSVVTPEPTTAPTTAPTTEPTQTGAGDGAGDGAAAGQTEGGTVELDDLTDAQLRVAYQQTLGKAPGGTKRPKLIEALKAAGYTAPAA